jgi:phage baseplate assembly protein W
MDKKDVREIVEKIIAAIATSQSVREVVARGNFGSALERNIDALSKMTATSVITVS